MKWTTLVHSFNGLFSRTILVSQHQKSRTIMVKPISIYWSKTVSGSGISWATCKSASRLKWITMPAPHHSVFYRPDALPAAQPTASKHWRQHEMKNRILSKNKGCLFFLLPKIYQLPEHYMMFARKILFLPNLGGGQLLPPSPTLMHAILHVHYNTLK